jgi:hypothetical protein
MSLFVAYQGAEVLISDISVLSGLALVLRDVDVIPPFGLSLISDEQMKRL